MKNYMSQVQNGQDSTSSNVESENNSQSPRSIVFRENKWVRPLKFCKSANLLKILQIELNEDLSNMNIIKISIII